MRLLDWISLTVCFWIFSNVAFAHEGHATAQPPPTVAAAPGQRHPRRENLVHRHAVAGSERRDPALLQRCPAKPHRAAQRDFHQLQRCLPADHPQAQGSPRSCWATRPTDITFISLTSDPLRDTPAVLKAYTLKQGSDDPHWLFLTGDKAQMDLVLSRIGQIVPTPEQHSTQLIVGDVANKRWSKIRPDAPAAAIAQRLQLLTMPVAGR